VPFHFERGTRDVWVWLAIDSLRSEGAVIDSCIDMRIAQRLIRNRRPTFAYE
jgi:hypothetical protein